MNLTEWQEPVFAQLLLEYPMLEASDVLRLVTCTDEERLVVITNFKNAGIAPTASFWDKFLNIFVVAATVAGVVTGISSGVQSVYALKNL